ncbi:MAG: hypothetical protein K5767_05070 [Clostridia bacterium]|nr:hypothetical protein [Clostridia bacterium]
MRKRGLIMIMVVLMAMVGMTVPAFAASGLTDDPYISVISPGNNQVMTSGNVLVSVKMTVPRTIEMSFYEVKGNDEDNMKLITSEVYSSTKNLSYYTRQLTDLDTGVYCLNISTLNPAGESIYATEVYIKVQKKASSSFQINVFNSKGTTSSFWSALLNRLLN